MRLASRDSGNSRSWWREWRKGAAGFRKEVEEGDEKDGGREGRDEEARGKDDETEETKFRRKDRVSPLSGEFPPNESFVPRTIGACEPGTRRGEKRREGGTYKFHENSVATRR